MTERIRIPGPVNGKSSSSSGGVSDHGGLTGLGDDDHSQYLLADGSRTLAGSLDVTGTVDGRDVSADGATLDALSASTSGTNTGDEPDATTTVKGIVELATDGETSAGVVVQGNDSRLSDARSPLAHTHIQADITDKVTLSKISDLAGQTVLGLPAGSGSGTVQELTMSQLRRLVYDGVGTYGMLFTGAVADAPGSITYAANSQLMVDSSRNPVFAVPGAGQIAINQGSGLVLSGLKEAIAHSTVNFAPVYPIWAEENGALGDGAYEWAMGNGANTPNGKGVTIGVTSKLISATICTNAATATSIVNIQKNGTTVATVTADGSTGTGSSTGLSVSFAVGDILGFQTSTAGGATSGPNVVTAWLERA